MDRRSHPPARTVRGVLATLVLAAIGAVSAPTVPIERSGTTTFADTLTELAEVVLCAAACWLAAATALVVVGSLAGAASIPARLAARITPVVWRRVLGVAVGGAIVLAPTAADATSADGADTPRIAGLRLPDRPSGEVPTVGPTLAGVVRVRPGDTLWDIASARLPAGADDTVRAAACRRWYSANRDAIGPDPNLLIPGTRLHPPHERTDR